MRTPYRTFTITIQLFFTRKSKQITAKFWKSLELIKLSSINKVMQFRLITILTDKVHFELLHRDLVLTWTLSFSFAFFSLWISYKNTIIIIFSIFLLYIFQNEINNIQSSSHTLHSEEKEWIQLRILSLPITWTEKILCKNCETHNTQGCK
jgi:hypothetical protein